MTVFIATLPQANVNQIMAAEKVLGVVSSSSPPLLSVIS